MARSKIKPSVLIERKLNKLWDEAAASSDHHKLKLLRTAFEALAAHTPDRPVLARKLTLNQVAMADDVFPEGDEVLGTGSTWLLLRNREAAQELARECPAMLDSALDRAMSNNIDMSEAQEAFTARSVKKSVDGLCRRLRKVSR